MKSLPLLCATLLLAGCLGDAPLNAGDQVLPDTSPEHFVAPLPMGWHLVHELPSKQITFGEYVPADETRLAFTQMMTVAWMPRTEYATLADLDTVLQANFTKACPQAPAFDAPRRFTDNGYAATLQTLRCARTPTGFAHYMVVKTIKTDNAYFQAQRAWRLAPAARSADVTVPPDALKTALAALDDVHVCYGSTPATPCGMPGAE